MFKKFRLIIYSFTLFFINISTTLADLCASDPLCYDPGSTNFNNQFHYVFVGVHPDDELTVYPLLKDFCAESNAYCAILIGSKGRTGCQFSTGIQCEIERTLELEASARYLESDA